MHNYIRLLAGEVREECQDFREEFTTFQRAFKKLTNRQKYIATNIGILGSTLFATKQMEQLGQAEMHYEPDIIQDTAWMLDIEVDQVWKEFEKILKKLKKYLKGA